VTVVEPGANTEDSSTTQLSICLDVSAVEVLDASRSSMVDTDRGDVHSMTIHLDAVESAPYGWVISDIEGREGRPQCGSE
ncbi:MAG TPA: hypothetical protein VFY91_10975, partial [Microbacterium sp.]|nr:hypothetical protein [Microbacterium sp.]